MDKAGSESNPLRVAVVGSGPAGFYATEELLKQTEIKVQVDLFDKLPTPYGLVRGGVAPDHQKIKSVIKLYAKTAAREGFRFFGNVQYGRDLSLEELLAHYHQLLFTTGAESDNRMGIPGEDLAGSFPATQFVGWYNGHPEYRHFEFDLSGPQVAVIGNGNVAMDVVRILAKPVSELETTDIADYALEALRQSQIKEIFMLGRRGPAQAAFTNPEIRELGVIEGADLVVRPEDLDLDEVNREFLEGVKEPTNKRNVEILTAQIDKGEGSAGKKVRAWFFTSPVEVLGSGRVQGLRIEKNQLLKDDAGNLRARGTGETQEISIQLIFRSIGYKGTGLAGVPFDERSGTIPNDGGRVIDPDTGKPMERVYVAGWIKRGPNGVIGTNKPDAIATVKFMLEDTARLPEACGDIAALLESRGCAYVSFADWQRIDQAEVARGEPLGRPRVKFPTVDEMLAVLK
ncbi:MAG: FAD-dependent oxidoreductase [SAR324 cluster bacterium]|nr:FAD-dependent oxidoreductase [SAR324 cluster bacterium]